MGYSTLLIEDVMDRALRRIREARCRLTSLQEHPDVTRLRVRDETSACEAREVVELDKAERAIEAAVVQEKRRVSLMQQSLREDT